jgi:type IV pilus assembly protein PilE
MELIMNKQKAFTLIELMIVVAIAGILAAIAYPSYQNSVMKSRRADAEGVLLGLANALERNFTETNSYAGYTLPTPTTIYYDISFSVQTASTYTLSAAPAAAQSSDSCGTLTLTETGLKSPATSGCW